MTAPQPITPWASDANFPAGSHAWSGQPTKVTPAYNEFNPSPSFAPSAQEFNALLNARDTALNAAIAYITSTVLAGMLNWGPLTPNPAGSPPDVTWGYAWYAPKSAWIGVVLNSVGIRTMVTTDSGANWAEVSPDFSTSYEPIIGEPIAVNPTTGDIVVIRIDTTSGGAPYVSHAAGLGAGYTDGNQAGVLPSGGMIGTTFFAPFLSTSGLFVFVGVGVSAGTGVGAFSLTNDGHGAWSAFALPSGWTAPVGSIDGYLARVKDDGTAALVAMCGVTPGSSDRSRLLSMPTPTDVTPSFLASGSMQIRGIAWDAANGLWGLATYDGTNSYVYSTPDLVTWTLRSTFATTRCAGLAVVQGVWAIYTDWVGNTNMVQLCSAITAGSPVWVAAAFSDGPRLGSRANVLGAFISNGGQLLAAEVNNTPGNPTADVRISNRLASF